MARRNVSASDIDFSGYYNEPEVNPITMAMQLLGMEAKSEESDAEKLMSWMKMQSEEQRAEEALGLQREQLGETRAGNVEARRLAQAQETRLGRALDEDIGYKKGQQDIERQKLIASALEKVAGVQNLTPEARLLIKNIPGMEAPFTQMEQETEMARVMPELQAAYAGTDAAKREAAIKMLYGKMSPYARENVNWQDLNALIKPDAPGFWSRFGGAGTPPTAASAGPELGGGEPVGEGYPLGEIIPPRRGYAAVPGVTGGPSLVELILGEQTLVPARPTRGYFTPK